MSSKGEGGSQAGESLEGGSKMCNKDLRELEASVSFGMLIDTTDSHLSLLPVVPEECWFFSNCQQFSNSPGGTYIWIFELPFGVLGTGVSFDPNRGKPSILVGCRRENQLQIWGALML